MQTREIESILDQAYHKAAGLAAYEVRRHLRPFNLKRHPISVVNDSLALGSLCWWEFIYSSPVHDAIREAGRYVEDLPPEVVKRLKDHL